MRFQRKLHKLVGAGRLDFTTAQSEIASDCGIAISLRALQNWDIGHRILMPSGKSEADKIAQWMNSL
jgi:hypothetical protein